MTQKYPNLSRLILIAAIVIGVGMVFNAATNRQPAAAEVLAVSAGGTDWYQDVMTNGTEWDKSFLPSDPAQVQDMSMAADPATTNDVAQTIAWYVTPTVKFKQGATTGQSEDGNITVETAGGNIKVTCRSEDAACANAKDAVADALADLEAARGSATE